MKKLSFSACLIALAAVPLVSAIKRVRSKIKEKAVSLVSKLFSTQTQKEGVRPVQKAFRLRELFQTAGIGTIYGLLFAGLLLMPFQSHQAIAADPPAEETVETQALPVLAIIGIEILVGIAVIGAWEGGKWAWREYNTPNGTIIAVADIVVDSIDGETTIWYTKRDEWAYQSSHDEDNASEWDWDKEYEFYEAHVSYVQWYQERYQVTDRFYIFGGFYWPSIINQGYNYGWTGDFETGKTGYLIEMGQAKSNYILHAFDSKVNRNKDHLLARQDNFTYTPEVDAEVSDMRYNGLVNGWSFTSRSRAIHRTADEMSAEDDAYQTVKILSTSMRLDDWEMSSNKSKVYWKRQTKTIPAGEPGTATFTDGSTMPTNMPFASDLTGPFPKQEITHHN